MRIVNLDEEELHFDHSLWLDMQFVLNLRKLGGQICTSGPPLLACDEQ